MFSRSTAKLLLMQLFNSKNKEKNCVLLSVVNQEFETDVGKEYVITGNSALMKCEIPSFVADLVQIVSEIVPAGARRVCGIRQRRAPRLSGGTPASRLRTGIHGARI